MGRPAALPSPGRKEPQARRLLKGAGVVSRATGGRGPRGRLFRRVPACAERWLAHDRDVAGLRHPTAVPHGGAGGRRPVMEREGVVIDALAVIRRL